MIGSGANLKRCRVFSANERLIIIVSYVGTVVCIAKYLVSFHVMQPKRNYCNHTAGRYTLKHYQSFPHNTVYMQSSQTTSSKSVKSCPH